MVMRFLLSFQLLCMVFILPVASTGPAIIQDKDGYTNVRKEPSTKAKVIHKLMDKEVFFAYPPVKENGWVEVCYQNKQGELSSGYVHGSRILLLSQMKAYKGKDVSLSYETRAFDAKNHRIGKNKNGGVGTIDGRRVWGTDGGLPRRETTGVKISLKGRAVTVDKNKYVNLYEVSKDYTVYQKDGYYFIEQLNSDGAGGYQLVWVLNEKGLQQVWVAALH